MSIIKEIKNRISGLNDGEIIMTSDFVSLTNITTARKCLGRCANEGLINRVFNGVYEKPTFSKLLNEYVPASPEKVAYALARKYHWSIAPCGDIALNKLGLTTQVPAIYSYVSDGPYSEYEWNNIKLRFKHKTNKEISKLSSITALVIEALKTLGKDNIDDIVIKKISRILNNEEKEIILKEASECSEWIYETIRKVCKA